MSNNTQGDPGLSLSQGSASAEDLSPMEQEILDEYARLVENLNTLSEIIGDLASAPSVELLDNLRVLERKTSLVYTLLRSSVYSMIMAQDRFQTEGSAYEGHEGS